MSHKLMALVSPRDQRTAVFNQLGSASPCSQPTVLLNGRTVTVGDYLARFPATEFIRPEHNADLSSDLSAASERSCALDFCMMLFDNDLSIQLKQRAANELNELLTREKNETYALDILLSHPLPHDTDFETAKAATQNRGEAYRVVCLLEETRKRAEFAFAAWLSVRKHPMVVQIGEHRVRGILILSGAIRRAVTELTTQSQMHELSGALVLNIHQYLDARVTQAFLSGYKAALPVGMPAVRSGNESQSGLKGESDAEGPKHPHLSQARFRHRNAEAEQERAVVEVESIAKLFLEGRDQNARTYRDELVARQSTVTDHSHLVKSLCNIASKCTTGGRYDVAAECLTDAMGYKRGVDSRLFVQMGNLFKDLQKFDEAADCLRKAEGLADNSAERDLINRELARLLVAKGEYGEALDAFRRLSDIGSAPESRTSMATLQRKMGDLFEARRTYNDVWLKHHTHQSFAGLAEINRQTGRLDKAIKKYAWLFETTKIDDRSAKIYQLTQSSLFRVLGNLEASRVILEKLHEAYKFDGSIQLEMAKVFRLMGDSARADDFYRRSFGRLHETDRLAAQLYETALMNRDRASSSKEVAAAVLPEFQTLAHCNVVLSRIIEGNLDALREIPAPAVNPFKLHAGFAAVLRYHSQILIGVDVNPVGDVTVNRIRKRGLKDLKMAVRALDRRDFDSALRFERQMCLRVA